MCLCSWVWFNYLQQRGSASVAKLPDELRQQPRVCVQHSGPDWKRRQHHCEQLPARTRWHPQGKDPDVFCRQSFDKLMLELSGIPSSFFGSETGGDAYFFMYNRNLGAMGCTDVLSQKLEMRSNTSSSTIQLGFIAVLKGVFTDLLSTTNVMQMHLLSTLHSWKALISECRCLI